MNALDVNGLCVSVGERILFGNLSLSVGPHEFVTLMGENGIGKTTLLETITGIRRAPSGDIRFWGRRREEIGASEFFARVAFVTATPERYPAGVTVGEFFGALERAFPEHWDREIAGHLLGEFKLETGKRMDQLSLGEGSKVRLLKALGFRPKLLLLDELAANLSPGSRDAVMKVLLDLFASSQEMSILYACHSKEDASRLSDRVLDLGLAGKDYDDDVQS